MCAACASERETLEMNAKARQDLEAFIDHLSVEKGLSRNTQLAYARDLCRFISWMSASLEAIRKEDIVAYLAHLKGKGLSSATLSRNVSSLRGFFQFLIGSKRVSRDPLARISTQRRSFHLPRTLTLQEIERLLNLPKRDGLLGLRDDAMIELLYATGLRVSELVSLKLADLHPEGEYLLARGKGDKERVVPLSPIAIQKTDLYLNRCRPLLLKGGDSPFLFLNRSRQPISRQGFWKNLRLYAKQI